MGEEQIYLRLLLHDEPQKGTRACMCVHMYVYMGVLACVYEIVQVRV